MTRTLSSLLVMALCSTDLISQDAPNNFVNPTEQVADFEPYNETILLNPVVIKTPISKNEVKAIKFWETSKPQFIVHFKKEQLHNSWTTFYNNNQVCDSGSLDKGLPDGEWKTWYPNGQLKTVRHYSAQKYRYIQADLHRGHPRLHRYKITGHQQQAQHLTSYFKPQYTSDASLMHNGLISKINHNTSGLHNTYVPPFTQSLHHGVFINYNEEGAALDSGYYSDGLKHGIWVETENNGSMRSVGYYHHGNRTGQWKHYNLQGTLLYSDFYRRNGTINTRHHFN